MPIGVEECRKKTYDLVSPRIYLHGLPSCELMVAEDGRIDSSQNFASFAAGPALMADATS